MYQTTKILAQNSNLLNGNSLLVELVQLLTLVTIYTEILLFYFPKGNCVKFRNFGWENFEYNIVSRSQLEVTITLHMELFMVQYSIVFYILARNLKTFNDSSMWKIMLVNGRSNSNAWHAKWQCSHYVHNNIHLFFNDVKFLITLPCAKQLLLEFLMQ